MAETISRAENAGRAASALTTALMSQRRLRPLLFALVDWRDRRRMLVDGSSPLPPAALRYRVHGDLSPGSFLRSGRQTLDDIRHALAYAGTNLDACRTILDFGCGCGRTLWWLSKEVKSADVHGADIDREAIAWCRASLPGITFTANDPMPPLPYPSQMFDLVCALSVFTHLDETYQFRWLDELRRIVRPNGYVLITVHGSYYWNSLAPRAVSAIKASGILVVGNPKFMDGLFPDWYQTTFHSQEYILARYAEYFDIVAYIASGLDACQDVVLLQRKL